MTTILVVTGNPSAYAAPLWPERAMNTLVWRFTFTFASSSAGSTYSGFHSLFCGPVVGGTTGGLFIVNNGLEYYDIQDNQVFVRAMTFSAGAAVTFTLNFVAKTVTISGATTGNGTFAFTDPGPYFNAGTTLTAGGVTGDPGFLISGTFGNIVDLAPEMSWLSTYPVSRLRRALPSALLAAVVAPVLPPSAPPVVPFDWLPEAPDQVAARRQPHHQSSAEPIQVTSAVAAPPNSWSPVTVDQVRPRRLPQHLSVAGPVADLPNPPVPPLSWSSSFPDRIDRRRQPQHLSVSGRVDPPPADPVPPLSWSSSFPDRIDRRRQPQHLSVAAPPPAGGPALTIGDAGIRQNILNAIAFSGNPLTTFGTDLTVTVNSGTDTLTATAHGMVMCAGPFLLTSSGSQPGGTSPTTPYYVNVTGANTFRLALTPAQARAGTVVDVTSDGTGTITLRRVRNTSPLYSTFVTVFSRGNQAASPNQATDSLGNAYVYISGFPRSYDNFPSSAASVAVKLSGRGGPAHTFSASIGNLGGSEDEVTIGGLEIFHAPILQASVVTEVADGSGATITSGTVTTTARALLVAVIFGNGNVNQNHTFTFLDGFVKIPQVSAEGDVDPAGYIQVAVAVRLADIKGTYRFRAQGTSSEGGQLALLAFQAATTDLSPLDWIQLPPAIPTRRLQFSVPGGELAPPLLGSAAPPFGWDPVAPDQVPRVAGHPRASLGEPAVGPVLQPLPPLTWFPVTPDHQVRVSLVRSSETTEPVALDALLAWMPSFPAHLVRTPIVVSAEFAPPVISLDAPSASWLTAIPDLATTRSRDRQVAGEAAPGSVVEVVPDSWSAMFPDHLGGRIRFSGSTEVGPLVDAPSGGGADWSLFPERAPTRLLGFGSGGPSSDPPRPSPRRRDHSRRARCESAQPARPAALVVLVLPRPDVQDPSSADHGRSVCS